MSSDFIKQLQSSNIKLVATKQKNQVLAFAKDIRISHTLFALPFVGTGLVLFLSKIPTPLDIAMIIVCMFFARSFAMGSNRYLDQIIDGSNPRTVSRQIPSGNLSPSYCLAYTLASGILFVFSSFYFGEICFLLSPVVLMLLGLYSMLKRWVWWTHLYLGFCLALSPLAAFVALQNASPPLGLIFLAIGICFWTAGFDLLYATQDFEFDRKYLLKSAATVFGIPGSVYLSRFCFVVSILFFVLAGMFAPNPGSGWMFWIATALMAVILIVEHYLISDLVTKGSSPYLNRAFFDLNAFVSLSFFILVSIGKFIDL